MLIFGGYYTSNLRFNDTYILKITNNVFTWSQPPNQKSGQDPKNSESKIGAPEPRACHSCTFYQPKEGSGKVYVFGGHGGLNYQRKAYNDVYVLDVESYEWTKLEPIAAQGSMLPDCRGGHTATLMADKAQIMIFGGWSFTSQFSNVMVYDINKNEWIDPEVSHIIPKWNAVGQICFSIPSWKYFIFGGSVGSFEEGGKRTDSAFVDDTYVIDIEGIKNADSWIPVKTESSVFPKARENPAIFYDQNDSRLIIHGGWSNNWLNDMWALNVSTITGPPYAIFDISPKLGPLTGRTKVLIKGDGFTDSTNIVVRFSYRKGEIDVPGTYQSETELVAETPSFENIGPKENVQIFVSIKGGDFTITSTFFTYYLNTKAENTLAYGPGTLPENVIGIDT